MAATNGLHAPKRIDVMGGSIGIGMATDAIHIYNLEFDMWTAGASMPLRWAGFALVVVDDVLYAMCGFDGWLAGYSKNLQYTPFGFGTVPRTVSVVSPENRNYTSSEASLNFMVNRPVVWMGYSLDGQGNVSVTGNSTLTGLASGLHNVTVYARDEFDNEGASETMAFTVAEPFPIELVAGASVATVALVEWVY